MLALEFCLVPDDEAFQFIHDATNRFLFFLNQPSLPLLALALMSESLLLAFQTLRLGATPLFLTGAFLRMVSGRFNGLCLLRALRI
jgi:hypothetical protein